MVNDVGVDINLLKDHPHWHNQLQFVSGFGPRKAKHCIKKMNQIDRPIFTRMDFFKNVLESSKSMVCYSSAYCFMKVRVSPDSNYKLDLSYYKTEKCCSGGPYLTIPYSFEAL